MTQREISDKYGMTDRESSVAFLVSQGMGNAEIASTLGVSEKTVKNTLLVIPLKMGLGEDRGGSLRVRIALQIHGVGPYASAEMEAK